MYSYCSNNLLNIKDVFIKKVVHAYFYVKVFIETKPSPQTCPCCGSITKRIHDYRIQTIKDLPFQTKHCFLVLRKRRYVCSCGKKFYENYSFLPRYLQRTNRLTAFIADCFHEQQNITTIARRANVSTATVNRVLDTIHFPKMMLPEVLSIDEFKGNAGNEKYQCILVDPAKHRVLDILPGRNQQCLTQYFYSFPKMDRLKVKFFVCDMWQPYVDMAQIYFPNAKIIIDKYHFIRQVGWAIEAVRKRLQKSMPKKLRKYFKHSRRLILTRYHRLSNEKKRECDLMLLYNDDLRKAHYLKEKFYEICQNPKYSEQRTDFWDWIKEAESSGIPEFEKCAKTYRNWSKYILNAYKYSNISNGPTEGFNNKIKVLKRTSYGIRNFEHFRTRILMVTN